MHVVNDAARVGDVLRELAAPDVVELRRRIATLEAERSEMTAALAKLLRAKRAILAQMADVTERLERLEVLNPRKGGTP